MGIRECAMHNEAFYSMYYTYTHREEELLKQKAEGIKILGCLGGDVPHELVLAAGMFPVQIYADKDRALTETDIYLEYAFDPVVRAQFEKLIDGTYYDLIDYLTISNSTDVLIRIYLYLKELQRVEPEKKVPTLTYIDWLFTRKQIHMDRNIMNLNFYKEKLEEWSGKTITDEDILKAIKICNNNRDALAEMKKLRCGDEVRISGSEALVIIGSSFFMDKEKHTALVYQVIESAKSWPVIDAPRIFVTGSNQEDLSLYEMIEDAGLVVVGDDHEWGDRSYEKNVDTDGDLITKIAERYFLRSYSSKKALVSDRVATLDKYANDVKADGVIFYTNRYEEAASWDYPQQKKSLESRDIKTLGLAKMLWPIEQNETLNDDINDFANTLKEGK